MNHHYKHAPLNTSVGSPSSFLASPGFSPEGERHNDLNIGRDIEDQKTLTCQVVPIFGTINQSTESRGFLRRRISRLFLSLVIAKRDPRRPIPPT